VIYTLGHIIVLHCAKQELSPSEIKRIFRKYWEGRERTLTAAVTDK
jgi:hypothetical protein